MNRSRTVGIVAVASCVLVLGLASSRVNAQAKLTKNLFSHVMKSAEVDAQFAKIKDSWDVYTKTNHAVTFRVNTKKLPPTNHQEADEYWFVRKGSAKVALQTGTPATSAPQVSAPATSSTSRETFRMRSIPATAASSMWLCGYSRRRAATRRRRGTRRWRAAARTDVIFRNQGADRQDVRRRTSIDAAAFPRRRQCRHDHLQRRHRSLRIA